MDGAMVDKTMCESFGYQLEADNALPVQVEGERFVSRFPQLLVQTQLPGAFRSFHLRGARTLQRAAGAESHIDVKFR